MNRFNLKHHPHPLNVVTAMFLVVLFLVPSGAYAFSLRPPTGTQETSVPPGPRPSLTHHSVPVVLNSKYDWPQYHLSSSLDGYAINSPLTSLNASKFGVGWATEGYGAMLDSPAIAYDPILSKTLVYIGTETGNVLAVNLASGQIVWGVWLGSVIRASPLVSNGSVYIETFSNPALFRLNATTGATQCTALAPDPIESTPTLATPPGGVSTLYTGTSGMGVKTGPFIAMNAANCSIEWTFTGFHVPAGSWSPTSYAVSKGGVPMVFFGTDDPDSSFYALNALTGHLIWRYQAYNPPGADFDVAAGITISPPGKNGFVQGVAYGINKAAIMYALDLHNGSLIWKTNVDTLAGVIGVARSTPALDGTSLVFGYSQGMMDLNATNGALMWVDTDPASTEVLSAPAIAGGHGHAIAFAADLAGEIDVVAVVGGALLYTYQTGNYITSSPAVSDGNVVIASADGFLFDFVLGGGNSGTLPSTFEIFPSEGAVLPNPNGNLTVSGNASDPTSVAAVNVAIQSSGSTGPWWDAANQSWSPGPIDNSATLVSPGAPSSAWRFPFPAPLAGGTFTVYAYAVSGAGESDRSGPVTNFAINASLNGPHLVVSTTFVPPGTALSVHGGGFGGSVNVALSLFGKTFATVTSAPNGSLPSTRFVIPASAAFGPTSIRAHANANGRTSSAAIDIENSWDQFGFGPARVGFEPNDTTLNVPVFPGGANNWIVLAWHFAAAGPIHASPAVVDRVAYVADAVGNVYAVDITNGGMIWNHTFASGAAVDGSPAVDPARGLVFVGADDGTVDALYLSNGSLAWSAAVGGNVSAPAYAGGQLYVTSSSGKVAALAESNGSVTWSTTLASSIAAAPSLNQSAHLLFVGEANGDVLGVDALNGSTNWTFHTAGAVHDAAMESGGIVYVGSDDHKMYALNQLTGAKVWSFTTGGPVRATPTLDSKGLLFVGSDDGNLYELRAAGHSQVFNFTIGSPIVSVSSVFGIEVFEDAAGVIGGEKTYHAGGGWKYHTGVALESAPVLLDGTVFVTGGTGFLYAFTSDGQPPV